MRKLYTITFLMLFFAVSLFADTDNIVSNGSFEDYTSNFLGTRFDDWDGSGFSVESTDKVDGDVALKIDKVTLSSKTIYQQISMATESTGQEFEITIWYKTLAGDPNTMQFDCYWDSSRDGKLDHDEAVLTQFVRNSTDWTSVTIKTTKPEGATNFYFQLKYYKGTEALLDNFSMKRTESKEPSFTVAPTTAGKVSTEVGTPKEVKTFTVRQYNLTTPVTVEITGVNSNMFTVDKTQLTQSEETVTVTYNPTAAGNHRATLMFDCTQATTSFTSVSLTGSATDPAIQGTITITPTTLPRFEAAVGSKTQKQISLNSENCYQDISIVVTPISAKSAFTTNASLMPKNTPSTIVVTFQPTEAGEYSSMITFSSPGSGTKTITVTGVATGGKPEDSGFTTQFKVQDMQPLDHMNEAFDDAAQYRNITLKKTGWQNIVDNGGTRPWWGYTEEISADSTLLAAKVTGYVYELPEASATDMQTWLITPPLKYNVENPWLQFNIYPLSVFEGQNAKLSVYYIDATDPENVYYQEIQELDAIIPANDSELSGKWVPVQLYLGEILNAPDNFYIGFKYVDKMCNNGCTYYIDDVIWGEKVEITGISNVYNETKTKASKFVKDGRLVIQKNGTTYSAFGTRIK